MSGLPRRRGLRACLLLVLLGLGGLAAGQGVALSRFDPDRLSPPPGPLVLDRYGRILHLGLDARGRKVIPLPPGPLPTRVVQAFVAAEDRRFWQHPGVDVLAVGRAMISNLTHGRIVSGASTLTMQLSRQLDPGPRTYGRKLVEMLRALRLEAALPKEEILRHFLNCVPLGGNLVGVETAARAYFGCPAAELTPAQAATLAALARAPERLHPRKAPPAALLSRRQRVLKAMASLGYLRPEALSLAVAEPLALAPQVPSLPFAAPHFVHLVLASRPPSPGGRVHTTLDRELQERAEAILRSHRERLRKWGAAQAAAVVVDHRQGELLTLVGSLEYGRRQQGMVNGATARRSPGSALKPFLYALALDAGLTPATLLSDVERRYRIPGGEFHPLNFDRTAHGPVSFREALGNSLNLAAVRLLSQVGPEQFYATLEKLDLLPASPPGPEHYGLGLAVGNAEVSLLKLAQAYATLAQGGLFRPLRLLLEAPEPSPRRVFSPQAAYIVSDILADPAARGRVFGASQAMNPPFPLALKTGTSSRYRDCWAVGFTREHTLAVWVGNFDGRPTREASGALVAAPILADLAAALYRHRPPEPLPRPPGVVAADICAFSGQRPGPACPHRTRELFLAGAEPTETCTLHHPGEPWHRLPPEYAGWLKARHQKGGAGRFRLTGFPADLERLFPATPGTQTWPSPGRAAISMPEAGATGSGVTIVRPLAGDRYVLPRGEEALVLTAAVEVQAPWPAVTWVLNGRELARTGPPYEVELKLPRGRHRLAALDPHGLGAEVEVMVE
ncbi:MAG: penicillin-binding protein 1C [Syntrophobacterales bacterium]|nr:penicillin-binding protein 1C [Syntrophobacterales bacterium]